MDPLLLQNNYFWEGDFSRLLSGSSSHSVCLLTFSENGLNLIRMGKFEILFRERGKGTKPTSAVSTPPLIFAS
jgi:hypothetical protein